MSEEFVGRGIAFPLRLDATGGIALVDHEREIQEAIRLIDAGARFICTNPDATGPSADGALPAAGSVAAMISKATGVEPYFVGKPNPMMMRSALNTIEGHSESTAMIGDRMDTDILCGLRGIHACALCQLAIGDGFAEFDLAQRVVDRASRRIDGGKVQVDRREIDALAREIALGLRDHGGDRRRPTRCGSAPCPA